MIGNFLFDLKNEVWSQRWFDEDQIEICRMVSFLLRWHVVHVIVISFLEICPYPPPFSRGFETTSETLIVFSFLCFSSGGFWFANNWKRILL